MTIFSWASSGPTIESMTGMRTSPFSMPKTRMRDQHLKKMVKMYKFALAMMLIARSVEKPP